MLVGAFGLFSLTAGLGALAATLTICAALVAPRNRTSAPLPRPVPREQFANAPLRSDRGKAPTPMTTKRTPAHARPRPLSAALDTTFKIGLVPKGLDGVLEVAGGILLLFLGPQAIAHVVRVRPLTACSMG